MKFFIPFFVPKLNAFRLRWPLSFAFNKVYNQPAACHQEEPNKEFGKINYYEL